jgi:hypothetical protein
MNKGIEILLERMDSNPEEFVVNATIGVNKWDRLLHNYASVLDKEDIEAYQAKLKQVAKDQFTAEVMKEILNPKPDVNPYIATGTTLGTWGSTGTATATASLSASGNLTTNSLTLGNQTLDAETLEHIKAHLDYIKKQEVQEVKKKATPR